MRELIHTRETRFRGYRREDGLWDIEAELLDTKGKSVKVGGGRTIPVGDAIHDLLIRVTIDSQYTVRAVETEMRAVPHTTCPSALAPMQKLLGSTMAAGWRKEIERNLGGAIGCAHLRELLAHMATVAFQTLSLELPHKGDSPPTHLGQCVSWDLAGSLVKAVYPTFAKSLSDGEIANRASAET